MRGLTPKQRSLLLKEWRRLHASGIEYPHPDDMPMKTYLEIDEIHPCEIYHWNVERFFNKENNKELKRKQARYS